MKRRDDWMTWVKWMVWMVPVALAGSGCSPDRGNAQPATVAVPRVEHDRITFQGNAPQLAYFKVEPAPARNTVASGLNGRLVWDEDVTSRIYPGVTGRVVEILASPGQEVHKGDVIARIRSSDFGQVQAEARKALADYKTAERAFSRAKDLFSHGAASAREVEEAGGNEARARAEKERALGTLSLYGGKDKASDGLFSLRTPVSGVIVEKSVNPGQEVRAELVGDRPLFVVTDPRRLWLLLDVSEVDVAGLRAGQDVVIRTRAIPDRVFHGTVKVIGEGLDASTRTIKARCTVDNSNRLLRAEMYVSADVSSSATGVDVSTTAVFLEGQQHYVFMETSPGQFQKVAVSVGAENEGRSVIVSGLTAGQRVVTDGSLLLQAILEGGES